MKVQKNKQENAYSDAFYDIEIIFEKFQASKVTKWEAYRIAFNAMDSGLIKLREIIEIAELYGVNSGVIKMRRLQWLAMIKEDRALEAAQKEPRPNSSNARSLGVIKMRRLQWLAMIKNGAQA